MLKEAARRLGACLGEGALISRVGSDQFAAAVACAGREEAEMHVLRLKEAVKGGKFSAAGRGLHTTASVGYCVHPEDGDDANALLRNASSALDHAKQKGADAHTAYTAEINERARRRLALELSLRGAAEVGALVVPYQPQVDMSPRAGTRNSDWSRPPSSSRSRKRPVSSSPSASSSCARPASRRASGRTAAPPRAASQ